MKRQKDSYSKHRQATDRRTLAGVRGRRIVLNSKRKIPIFYFFFTFYREEVS